jgi:hypothetical protein
MSFKTWLRGNKDEEPENKTEKEADGTPPPVKGNTPPPPADIPGVPVTLEDITRGMQYAATAANEMIAQQYMKALDPFLNRRTTAR